MNCTACPLVSVVIPTFNHAHFLLHALRSVLDQTYTNWEAIVVDNHSQDNTDEVVNSFADPRISLLKIHNQGVIAASRNMGIRAAQGEWIAFLDSDDLWYPEKLEVVVKHTQSTSFTDVCSTDEVMVNKVTGARQILEYGPYCQNFYQSLLIEGNRLSPSATLVRRDFLIEHAILFREQDEFVTAEDYDFWMLLARASAKFTFINSIQGEYTIHATNNSGQVERHNRNVINVIKDHVYRLQAFQPDKDKLWSKIKVRFLFANAKGLIARKQYISGVNSLVEAFRSSFGGSLHYLFSRLTR